ncbi:tetratricopeptide repeat protein [Nannocystis radixulma]|uniref:Tetratricopeptide repeat protein n=1 Tax=Nannocystis radixulma TaxID=2995305 RepID=A0ABT5BGJ2_9BACT|nr:tetratricopeptide repeat protein [Nannocystis radixulma]MDC0672548.1 tetratricopeptide repeat protein [Nannocystis radixulma]
MSTHKAIANKLTGDLWLVTVREESLWLVAVLQRPRHDGRAWTAAANLVPVVDITELAGELEFDSGTGVNVERMAMSLQTPRGLTAGDVAKLKAAAAGGRSAAIGEAELEAVVVKITAAVLDRTEAEVRADRNRYATFQVDDGFAEESLEKIDWSTMTLDVDEPPEWLYGRTDLDLRRSLFESDAFDPETTTDRSLRALLARQRGALYGEQIAALVAQKRLSREVLADVSVVGRLRGETSLLAAMRSLLMLHDFPGHQLEPCDYAETHESWVDLLATIEPPALREHLALFFQDENAARCCGAYFESGSADIADVDDVDDVDDAYGLFAGDERYEALASWAIGEGQGTFCLVRIVDDTIAPVPEFTGHALLRKTTTLTPGATPPASGRSDEITAVPLKQQLAQLDADHPLRELLGGDDPQATLAALVTGEAGVNRMLDTIEWHLDEDDYRTPLALLAACPPSAKPRHRLRIEYLRGLALARLHCFAEALTSAQLCLKQLRGGKNLPVSAASIHHLLARSAYHVGQHELALEHADRALELEPDLLAAHATRGCVLFARGDRKAAFKALEKAMKDGTDPEPRPELAADPKYRELALRCRIPVELSDEEAVALGVD